ncbi:nitronate monooxygenase family protein [Marinobacter sp. 1_MG-2023]|uniref:NAD(P)H-dependent flavin oxidoreductase n=1 Tax=Marinobacter sp. 1_MG-2023 TaxID=3062627 RepID=UPI0026E1A1BC|nr:nitronate monooxygenase [Marinobacter sp. 1_MG-2023]MDO6824958.1 nitronate monooxygenase [Marinobacter sp. 1_MG-2023]
MNSHNSFLKRSGIRYPIVQAPMAGVSTPQLAASVTNAGGLGSLGIGASSPAQAREMIKQTQALTTGPFNVNVFCHQPARRDPAREANWLKYLAPLFAEAGVEPPDSLSEIYTSFVEDAETLEMLLELKPAVVSFHFGIPSPEYISALQGAGVYTMATATSPGEAAQIEAAGIDAIVAQGIEAGGHRGTFNTKATDEGLSTLALVRLLSHQTTLPIVAAGAIMDGFAMKAAMASGAAAVQLGTAFVLCPESAANDAYRAALKSERVKQTRLTKVLSGRPARGMVNRLISFGEAKDSPPPADYPVAYDAAKYLNGAASRLGNHEFAAQWAGQGAPLARELPAADLVALILEEWVS